MSATTDIYVSPSTSLILIKNLSSPVNVYLRAYNTLPFTVSIRDTTGLSSLAQTPIRISTVDTARFVDGTSYYPLNTPYGFVNLTLRNSNTWTINHTSGQLPATAAATIGTLSAATTYIGFQSTAQKIVSTLYVETLTTPNSISITGPFIVSNLSTPGFVLFEQNLNVYGRTELYNQLNISANTFVRSSFFVEDLLPLSFPVVAYSSVGIGGNAILNETLHVGSTLHLQSTIQVNTLQTTQSTLATTTVIQGPLQVASLVSTLGNLAAAQSTTVAGNLLLGSESFVAGSLSTSVLQVKDQTTIRNNLSSLTTASFGSSMKAWSTLEVKGSVLFQSTVGAAGTLYTSSLSTLGFSTLGSMSTNQLEILSTAQISGTVSTVLFQSYQFLSIAGTLYTPAVLSSLGNTNVAGSVSVRDRGIIGSLNTSSSVGIGGNASIVGSTFASHVAVGGDAIVGGDFYANGGISTQANLAIRTDGMILGNLIVLGATTIPNFIVNSYLLSNLQIQASSPYTSFRASSLHASTMETELARVFSEHPLTVSSVFASTVQASRTIVEDAVFEQTFADSFYVGSNLSLASDSMPKFGLTANTQMLEGFSTVSVLADRIEAGRVEGSFVGTVSYLSNVPVPFSNLSGITLALSSILTTQLLTSSFTASTLIGNKFIFVQSSVNAPYISFESQGYSLRADTSQFLNLSPTLLAVNRSLVFNAASRQIGLGTSNPVYDFDVSGLVYTEDLVYSSINTLTGISPGILNLSTIIVSSSYVRDSLQFGTQGLQIASAAASNQNAWVDVNTIAGHNSNGFGIFDFVARSSIFLNSGIEISRSQTVFVNPYFEFTSNFLESSAAFDLRGVARADEFFVSSASIFETVQAKTMVSRNLIVSSNPDAPINRISTSFGKLFFNDIFVLTSDSYLSNRYVGVGTSVPEASLDVQGNAYFSTARTVGSLQAELLAMRSQEI